MFSRETIGARTEIDPKTHPAIQPLTRFRIHLGEVASVKAYAA